MTNGSDHPARVAGAVRAYVRTEGPFTYQRWLDGVRHGRTFVTSGPLVMLTVNGVEIGDTLSAAKGTRLRIVARYRFAIPLGYSSAGQQRRSSEKRRHSGAAGHFS